MVTKKQDYSMSAWRFFIRSTPDIDVVYICQTLAEGKQAIDWINLLKAASDNPIPRIVLERIKAGQYEVHNPADGEPDWFTAISVPIPPVVIGT